MDFASSVFELALHEMISRLDLRLISVEASVANGRAPDFLVEDSGGRRFYIEAVNAFDISDAERVAEARLDAAVQALDEASSPIYHLLLSVAGYPSQPVPLRRFKESFQKWIDNLQRIDDSWDFEFSGAQFKVRVLGLKTARLPESRAISARDFGGRMLAPHAAIREALSAKASRYGALEYPFVIAINSHVVGQDESDFLSALFGSEVVNIPLTDEGAGEPILTRAPDGLWLDRRGMRRRGVSAVLYFDRFSAWTANARSPILALNPWAVRPLDLLPRLKTITVIDDVISMAEGVSLQDLFQLSPEWPGPE